MIKLINSDTTDTMLKCSKCGEEMRYNYANSYAYDEASLDTRQRMYDAWVAQIIEDETQEHECSPDPQN